VVVKKDGRREPFDRVKAQTGIMRACEKRPISVETIDQLVDSIERSLNELYLREVPSRQVGELILKALRTVDEIAYIRFASVYQEFSDVHQFVEILRSLGREQFTTEVADDS
jgi:transcriptional repressor NrdR